MRKTQSFYKAVISSSPYAYALQKVLKDKEGKASDFIFLEVNPAFERISGFEAGRILGKRIQEIVPEPSSRKDFIIEKFGSVAFEGREEKFEIHSKEVDAWYRIEAFCPKRGYCVVLAREIVERRGSGRAAKNIEEALKALEEISQIQICRWTPDMTLTFVNSGYATAYGFSQSELLGKNWIYRIPEKVRNEVAETYRKLAASPRSHSFEHEVRGADGSIRWILWTDIPEFDETGHLVQFLSIGQDITDLKETKEALTRESAVNAEMARLSEKLILIGSVREAADLTLESAKLLTGSPHGFVGYTDTSSGLFISPTMAQKVPATFIKNGIPIQTASGLIGKILSSRIALMENDARLGKSSRDLPDDHLPIARYISAPAVQGDAIIGRIVVANSSKNYTESDKKVLERLASVFSLGIRRREVQEALEESERKWRMLVENAPDAICVHSKGRFAYVNPKFLELFRLSSAVDILGTRIIDHVHPDYQEFLRKRLRRIDNERIFFPPFEQTSAKPDGIRIEFETTSMPIVYEGLPSIITFFRDIAQRKKAEQALKVSLREKNVLLQELHHRVKNNIQVISSLLNIQAKSLKDEKSIEIFRDIDNRIRSIALVHEKLYKSDDLARIDYADYVRGLVGHLFHARKIDTDRIAVRLETEEIFLDINTAVPCGLLINELISNALKHAFPGTRTGELVVSMKKAEPDRIRLIVKDNGIGLPANLDIQNSETLGMQLVIMLVEQIKGTIELKNDSGTEFRVIFPGISPQA